MSTDSDRCQLFMQQAEYVPECISVVKFDSEMVNRVHKMTMHQAKSIYEEYFEYQKSRVQEEQIG